MANLVMKIGTWGIAHNADHWIVGFIGVMIVCAIVWDYRTTNK